LHALSCVLLHGCNWVGNAATGAAMGESLWLFSNNLSQDPIFFQLHLVKLLNQIFDMPSDDTECSTQQVKQDLLLFNIKTTHCGLAQCVYETTQI